MRVDSPLIAARERLSYFDSQSIALTAQITPLQAWDAMTAKPLPGLRLAFWLRDKISGLFGVKKIGGFTKSRNAKLSVGDKLDFFLIEAISDRVMVLTERDRHLDVMTTINTGGCALEITSSVITHNGFGKAYMVPVGPAHRLIVRWLLRRLQAQAIA